MKLKNYYRQLIYVEHFVGSYEKKLEYLIQ